MTQRLKTLLSITLRSLKKDTSQTVVETLHNYSDLTITPPDQYNFADNTVGRYRFRDGKWRRAKRGTPKADIWIVWIDGYALNHKSLGFRDSMDFFHAAQDFFHQNLQNGNVGAIYNSPEAERNTLKDFLADLDSDEFGAIPSYRIRNFDDLADIYNTLGPVVVKPVWGGLRRGIGKVTDEWELQALRHKDLSNHVAQLFHRGPEKRLWIANGRCPQGAVHYGKNTPWSGFASDYHVVPHYMLPADEVARDIYYAERMAKKVGLNFGSVDFIGDRINEVNGAGTGHVMWDLTGEEVIDARPVLHGELKRLLGVS